MKLIIQIPCYNEESDLPQAVASLPTSIDGVDMIEILVINDGSTDRTVEVAKALGVNHILSFPINRGLAHGFCAGILECARLGANVVVNYDADSQYCADDIPKLIAPILSGSADIVVGERPISHMLHFSPVKRKLQRVGSWVVRRLGGHGIEDAPSGFRAMSLNAMVRLHVFNPFTYTHESLIAAREQNLKVVGVPIRVNPGIQRPSRLVKSTFDYVMRSGGIILRSYLIYNPYRLMVGLSGLFILPAILLLARFCYYYFIGQGSGYIQSLVIASMMLLIGVLSFLLAVVCDLLRVNRQLAQKMLEEFRRERISCAQTREAFSSTEVVNRGG